LVRNAAFALALAAASSASAQEPAAGAALVLAPRLFPVFQAWDVRYPYAVRDRDRDRYLLYYSAGGVDSLSDAAWDFRPIGVATSEDGVHFQDPPDDAPAVAPGPYAEGQVIDAALRAAHFDSLWAFGAAVVADETGFRMWYTGWDGDDEPEPGGLSRQVGFRIGLATSSDGLRFTKQPGAAGAGAVLAPGPDAGDAKGVAQPAVLEDADGYRMWYEGFDGASHRIFLATSKDGLAWTKRGLALDVGGPGAADELGARNPVVIRRRGRLELWYQGVSRGAPRFHALRAVSDDGASWIKLPGEVALDAGAPLADDEERHVDSVLVRPDGSCLAFFARQSPLEVSLGEDLGSVRRESFRIFSELVDP
jgi:hypothetical protein